MKSTQDRGSPIFACELTNQNRKGRLDGSVALGNEGSTRTRIRLRCHPDIAALPLLERRPNPMSEAAIPLTIIRVLMPLQQLLQPAELMEHYNSMILSSSPEPDLV